MAPRLERAEDGGWPEPGKVGEQTRVCGEHAAVVARVGDEQEEVVRRVIAELQPDPSLDSLRVAQPHLELDRRAFAPTANLGVPGPLFGSMGSRRQRDLGPKSKR